jgi:hypothetical protein
MNNVKIFSLCVIREHHEPNLRLYICPSDKETSETLKSVFLNVFLFTLKALNQTQLFIFQSDFQYSTPGIRKRKICATD